MTRNVARRRRTFTTVCGAALALALALGGCSSSGSGGSGATNTGKPASAAGSTGSGTGSSSKSKLPADLQSKSSIDVAAVSDYPPLSYAQNGNNADIVGFDIDVLNKVADVLGTKFNYKDTSYDSLIPSLQSGRVLLAEGGASDTADAIKATTLIDYLRVGAQMAVPSDNPKHIKNFNDMCGHTMATLAGTPEYLDDLNGASKKYCTSAGKSAIKVSVFPTEDQVLLAVNSGRADAAYSSQVGNIYRIQQGLKFTSVGDVLEFSPISFQVPKDRMDLATAIKGALNQMIADGSYATLVKKWGFPADSALKQAAINSAASDH